MGRLSLFLVVLCVTLLPGAYAQCGWGGGWGGWGGWGGGWRRYGRLRGGFRGLASFCYANPLLCRAGPSSSLMDKIKKEAPAAVKKMSPRDIHGMIYALTFSAMRKKPPKQPLTQQKYAMMILDQLKMVFKDVSQKPPASRLQKMISTLKRHTPKCFKVTPQQLTDMYTAYVNMRLKGKVSNAADVADDFQLFAYTFAANKPLRFETIPLAQWVASLTVPNRFKKYAKCGKY